ncbi:selenium metabolism-associated LysR family transcriptional regulator [Chloroflexota bacterium]
MDIRKIEAFLRAAETSNLSEASKQLHLSQPALSQQIKLLEKELGGDLFIRSNTGLKLTEAGHLLLPWARRLIHDTNDMKDMMLSLQNVFVGDLRIACSSTSGKYVVPLLVARFCTRYPGVQARILACKPEYAVVSLLEDEAHLGIVSSEVNNSSLESQEFFRDEISLVVPSAHPWAKRTSIEASEILQEPMILREGQSGTRRVMLAELAKFDISLEDLKIFLELGNVEAILEVVAEGYGISFVSDLASSCLRSVNRIAKVKVDGMSMERVNYMMRKRNAPPQRPRDVFWGFVHAPENSDLLSPRAIPTKRPRRNSA